MSIVDAEYEFNIQNTTDISNTTDIELPIGNNNDSILDEAKNSTVGNVTEYFNSLYRLFFNTGHHNSLHENSNSINILNKTENATINQDTNNLTNQTLHSHHKHDHKTSNKTEVKANKKSNRCVEADYAVCKSWSKRRLLNAQKCCSGVSSGVEVHDRKSCHYFGKKRCKKIQSILKCCIKTVYTEATDPPSTTEDNFTVTETPGIVCCRTMNEEDGNQERECRVSYTGTCKEDEFVQNSSSNTK